MVCRRGEGEGDGLIVESKRETNEARNVMDNIWFIGFLGGKIWTGSENISCVSDEFFFFFVSFLLRRITRTILLSNVFFFFLIFRDRFGDNLLISVLREITKFEESKRYLYVRYRGSKIALSHPPATNRVTLGVLAIGCKEFLL